jgi:hypothetical protein
MPREIEHSKVQVYEPKINLKASALPARAGKRMNESPRTNNGKLKVAYVAEIILDWS